MFFRRGGNKNPDTQPGRSAAASPPEGDQPIAAALAVKAIVNLYAKNISRNGTISPDTLFCSLGAVAGFAAQHAVLEDLKSRGLAPPCEELMIVKSKNGESYFLGDKLNALLVPEKLDSMSAFTILGGAAMQHGADAKDLPDCLEMFEHALATIGTDAYGVPRLPEGQRSWLAPRKAVEIFWPAVKTAFTREPIVPVPGFRLVESHQWPLLLAKVGVIFMDMLKPSGIAPARAVKAFMEAAVPMSKIDPASLNFSGKPN
ncbi:MAG: hypothetical protein JSS20_02285 [Proteobacteria bacterium]|nr:hypothetical protein [Pseudomonadota bacterium]